MLSNIIAGLLFIIVLGITGFAMVHFRGNVSDESDGKKKDALEKGGRGL